LLLLLLTLLLRPATAPPAPATPAANAFGAPRLDGSLLLGLLWLRRRWRTPVALATLLRWLRTLTALLPVLFAWLASLLRGLPLRLGPSVRARRATALALPVTRGLLLEFLDLAGHELPCPQVQAGADLIMAAVRAASPSLGIGPLAGGAENAFR